MYRNPTLRIVLCLAAMLSCTSPARADYEAGQTAWETGRHAEALAQWQAAAKTGDARAMLALGRAYVKGLGVPQDYVEAHKWLNLAAAEGNAQAASERDALAAKMTAEERSEAQKLARTWRSGSTVDAPKAVAVPQATAPSPPAGPPPPRAIREAQELMAALGYDSGPADGRWGPRTGRAYTAFLRDAGLPLAEVLTPDALRAMRTAAKRRNVAATAASPRPAPATQRKPARPPANLHRLVAVGDIDGVKAALARGADTNARDGKGWTALMHAADKGRTLLVPPLLKAGSDPNIRASDGATALFVAAMHGHSEILKFLLAAEADPSIKGPKGMTAINAARARYGTFYEAQKNGEELEILILLAKGLTIRDVVNVLNQKFVQCDGRATGLRASLSGKDTIRIGVRHREGRLGEYEINITTIEQGNYFPEKDVMRISSYAQNIRSLHENKNVWGINLPTCGDKFANDVLQLLADVKSLSLSGLIDLSPEQRSEITASDDWRKYFR